MGWDCRLFKPLSETGCGQRVKRAATMRTGLGATLWIEARAAKLSICETSLSQPHINCRWYGQAGLAVNTSRVCLRIARRDRSWAVRQLLRSRSATVSACFTASRSPSASNLVSRRARRYEHVFADQYQVRVSASLRRIASPAFGPVVWIVRSFRPDFNQRSASGVSGVVQAL